MEELLGIGEVAEDVGWIDEGEDGLGCLLEGEGDGQADESLWDEDPDLPDDAGMPQKPDDFGRRMIAGEPVEEGPIIQKAEASCALDIEQEVLKHLGFDVDSTALENLAVQQGWYDPEEGTLSENVGMILEAHGVEVERRWDWTLTELLDALESGEEVIVALDAEEVRNPQRGPGGAPLEKIDQGHAVWVASIDLDDNGNISLVLKDPGNPKGSDLNANVSDFLNAWADFGNFAVVTRNSGANDTSGLSAADSAGKEEI